MHPGVVALRVVRDRLLADRLGLGEIPTLKINSAEPDARHVRSRHQLDDTAEYSLRFVEPRRLAQDVAGLEHHTQLFRVYGNIAEAHTVSAGAASTLGGARSPQIQGN